MQKSASRSIQSAYAAAIAVTVLLSGIAAAEQIEWPLVSHQMQYPVNHQAKDLLLSQSTA